jgi:hypothetical protein
MREVWTGIYPCRERALRAAEALLRAGFTREEVCMLPTVTFADGSSAAPQWLAPEVARGASSAGVVGGAPAAHFAAIPRTGTMAGIGGGALVGLGIGAFGGLLHAFAGAISPVLAVALPGLGSMAHAPILTALIGAGAGSASGALLGAVVGRFRVRHEAVVCQDGQAGFSLVGVAAPRCMARSAVELLETSGASKVTRGDARRSGRGADIAEEEEDA